MAEYDLSGKTAIVTGASSGIGPATAKALAAAGVRVAGGARRVERLETEIALELDVTDPASCERFVAQAVEQLGGLNILFNNAGLALGRVSVRRVERGGRSGGVRDQRERPRAHDAALPAAHPRRRPHRQHGLGRRAAGVREGRDATSPRSSPCAASRTRCAKTCSAGRSGSRPSTAGSSRRSSRSSASRATPSKAAAVYEGIDPLTAEDIADCVMWAVTRPWHVNVDEIVVKARNQASGGRILRET